MYSRAPYESDLRPRVRRIIAITSITLVSLVSLTSVGCDELDGRNRTARVTAVPRDQVHRRGRRVREGAEDGRRPDHPLQPRPRVLEGVQARRTTSRCGSAIKGTLRLRRDPERQARASAGLREGRRSPLRRLRRQERLRVELPVQAGRAVHARDPAARRRPPRALPGRGSRRNPKDDDTRKQMTQVWIDSSQFKLAIDYWEKLLDGQAERPRDHGQPRRHQPQGRRLAQVDRVVHEGRRRRRRTPGNKVARLPVHRQRRLVQAQLQDADGGRDRRARGPRPRGAPEGRRAPAQEPETVRAPGLDLQLPRARPRCLVGRRPRSRKCARSPAHLARSSRRGEEGPRRSCARSAPRCGTHHPCPQPGARPKRPAADSPRRSSRDVDERRRRRQDDPVHPR